MKELFVEQTGPSIMEDDKLIAVFMGREVHTDGIGWFDEKYNSLKYDDWNNLMPVVEKCLCAPEDLGKQFDTHYDAIHDALWSISIDATYEAVVKYIKWYNTKLK